MKEERDKSRFGFPTSQAGNYSVTDCRGLVKTLVCGVKTITWGCASCKVSKYYCIMDWRMDRPNIVEQNWHKANICFQNSTGDAGIQSKQFQPKETLVFIRLVKWALQALDIYTLSATPLAAGTILPGGQRTQSPQTVRTKEEKEVLEHFAGVVSAVSLIMHS